MVLLILIDNMKAWIICVIMYTFNMLNCYDVRALNNVHIVAIVNDGIITNVDLINMNSIMIHVNKVNIKDSQILNQISLNYLIDHIIKKDYLIKIDVGDVASDKNFQQYFENFIKERNIELINKQHIIYIDLLKDLLAVDFGFNSIIASSIKSDKIDIEEVNNYKNDNKLNHLNNNEIKNKMIHEKMNKNHDNIMQMLKKMALIELTANK